MKQRQKIQLFEDKKVRTAWDDELQEWFFSVVDTVEVLTDSKDPKDYLKKMRKRDPELDAYMGTNCPLVPMLTSTGKHRKTLAANSEQLFRLIQSIPSKKAEPFKQWMAQVARERLDQMADPELAIDQAIQDWRRKGYSESWINNRVKSIEVRKALTDEWDRAGVQQGQQYASLTDIITREWSGKTTRQYKQFKGLKKESLRDNMTNTELILNMLAESAATDLSREQHPQGYSQSAKVAKKGGSVAKAARDKLEQQLGHSVISPTKASDFLPSAKNPDILGGSEDNEKK
jgi:prophage antirepressor-like protein